MPVPYGREKIIAKYEVITAENVFDALQAALSTHRHNSADIDFLHNYYRGVTPILDKTKAYRQEVNNKVGCAIATEIVSFFVGYIIGDPITYTRMDSAEDVADRIDRLNEFCRLAGKQECDTELIEWALVCGTAYRACAPEKRRADETPFKVYSLDPRKVFVAYSRSDGKTPIFSAGKTEYEDGATGYIVSTDDAVYEIDDMGVVRTTKNEIGYIPIVEYPANPLRIGVIEPVLSELDALETIQSSRVDAVVQDVDNVLAIIGCDPGDKDEKDSVAAILQELKMLVLPPDSDAKYITAPLKQGDIQTVYDSVYTSVLTTTGVPNRNGGSSTSDTGKATEIRDGWIAASGRAKQFEGFFRASELEFLRVANAIARLQGEETAAIRDIEVKFPPRYAENVLVRAQAFQLLTAAGIAPEDALPMVSLVSDPLNVAIRNRERIDRILFGNENAEETGNDENANDKNAEGAEMPDMRTETV